MIDAFSRVVHILDFYSLIICSYHSFFGAKKESKKHGGNELAPSAYGFLRLCGAVAERLRFAHLVVRCLPSVAQTNIFAVGCVASPRVLADVRVVFYYGIAAGRSFFYERFLLCPNWLFCYRVTSCHSFFGAKKESKKHGGN